MMTALKPYDMTDYYAAREAQERRAEDWSLGYATETEQFYQEIEARLTFKAWLQGSARPTGY